MLRLVVFLAAGALAALWLFSPEWFPRCACCKKIKPRRRFQYHLPRSMRLTRKGNESLCQACCEEHQFHSLAEFRKKQEIEKRMEYKVKWFL